MVVVASWCLVAQVVHCTTPEDVNHMSYDAKSINCDRDQGSFYLSMSPSLVRDFFPQCCLVVQDNC